MYRLNKVGYNAEPCGTPFVQRCVVKDLSLIYCFVLLGGAVV